MAQRNRIGLIFSYDEAWIAGSYYILNIIHSLKVLPSSKQPRIVIISESYSNFEIVKKETKYKFLEFVQIPIQNPSYNIFERLTNKLGRLIGIKKVFSKKPKRANIQFLYPFEADIAVKQLKKVNWIPDFQEEFLPEYFSDEEIEIRKNYRKNVISKGDMVVLSSKDSLKHFNNIYPNATANTFVLPFAVTHPNIDGINIEKLRDKYLLPKDFYFVPNQFWAHKNHQIVLDALKILKDKGDQVHVAFSGKETDYRNKDYFQKLKEFVINNGLQNNVSFLGFLDRKDQLCLMKNAIAIIQPSLFEGWSTVVEDAKALGQFIILSDLPVHLEQANKNVQFFDPGNAKELADFLQKYNNNRPVKTRIDYNDNKLNFALNFLELVKVSS